MGRGAAARQGKRQGDFLAGKYLLEDCLGIGGMGEVYRATNVSLGRKVAIKLLSAQFVNIEDDVMRFLREARAAAAITHTNVVDVFDVARDDDGTPFIVQELLSGEDLERYLRARGGTLSPGETLEIMIPVADAVAAAHAQNVVHRDLKPANIFLARANNKITPKVLDFGACLFPTMGERSAKEAKMLIGTPHYMAPEQIISKSEVDARSDVWALGVILYEMMVGETPFEGETAAAVMNKVKTMNVPPLRARVPSASDELERVIAKCTDRDRMARYADASGVRDALERVRHAMKGGPAVAAMETIDDFAAPAPKSKATEDASSAPRIPSIRRPAAPKHASSFDLELPLPQEPAPAPPPKRIGLLTLNSPDEEPSPQPVDELSFDLDIPLPIDTPKTPPAMATRREEHDPSGVRELELSDDLGAGLDIAPFMPEREEEPIGRSQPSSLPPVLFTAGTAAAVQKRLPPNQVPFELREDLSASRMMKRHEPQAARPVGPRAVRAEDFQARPIEVYPWRGKDTLKLGTSVAIPALLFFLGSGLMPMLSQPVRHALLGDSPLASGTFAVVSLVVAAVLCARAGLVERTRLAWVAAISAVVFGIVMIIATFGATEAAEAGNASTTSLATLIGPLTPLVLAFDWLTKARDFWTDPYSRTEARRGAALASLFLFLTLAFSPFGAVRAPQRPMKAIEAMLTQSKK